MNFANNNTQKKEMPCKFEHVINGIRPAESDNQLDGTVCDCTKFIFQSQPCGCPGKKKMLLKEVENPNYKPVY